MFEQSFALADVPRIFTLAFLELLLSADNAVVLGVLSHALPPPLRRKALLIGLSSAFVLRGAALLAVSVLLKYPWVEFVGAVYLVYLSVRYFAKKRKAGYQPAQSHSFWKTVLLIESLDLVFAIDSMVAGVAFIDAAMSKLWIVYAGGMIGLFGMRYAADLFSSLLDRFPRLESSAYLLVGWIGVKLGVETAGATIPPLLFWSAIVLFFILGFFRPVRLK